MTQSGSMASSHPSKPWSETGRGRIIILLGVMGLFALVFWMAMKSRRMLTPKSALVVDEQYLSFGEVWEDPAFVWTLPIRNTTNQDVEIAGFAMDCSCSRIEPSALSIPAQGKAEVRLTLDLRNRPRSHSDLERRDFKVHIQPRLTKGTMMLSNWMLHGKVRQPFLIEPPLVDFEDKLVRGQPFVPISVSITTRMKITELTAHSDSPILRVKAMRDTKEPNRFRLVVRPSESTAGEWFHQQIRLVALTPNKMKIFGTLLVVGRVLEDVGLQPESFSFGAQSVGVKVQGTVTLQSRSGQEFSIQAIDGEGSRSVAFHLDRRWKDGRQSYIVSCPVEQLGNQKNKIRVKVKTPQGLLNVPLQISYYGVQ